MLRIMFYLADETEDLSLGGSLSEDKGRARTYFVLQQKPSSQNIKRLLLLNEKADIVSNGLVLVYEWEDASVWAHQNHSFGCTSALWVQGPGLSCSESPQRGGWRSQGLVHKSLFTDVTGDILCLQVFLCFQFLTYRVRCIVHIY